MPSGVVVNSGIPEPLIELLTGLGYPAPLCEAALKRCRGNPDQAIELLLSGYTGEPTPSVSLSGASTTAAPTPSGDGHDWECEECTFMNLRCVDLPAFGFPLLRVAAVARTCVRWAC